MAPKFPANFFFLVWSKKIPGWWKIDFASQIVISGFFASTLAWDWRVARWRSLAAIWGKKSIVLMIDASKWWLVPLSSPLLVTKWVNHILGKIAIICNVALKFENYLWLKLSYSFAYFKASVLAFWSLYFSEKAILQSKRNWFVLLQRKNLNNRTFLNSNLYVCGTSLELLSEDLIL